MTAGLARTLFYGGAIGAAGAVVAEELHEEHEEDKSTKLPPPSALKHPGPGGPLPPPSGGSRYSATYPGPTASRTYQRATPVLGKSPNAIEASAWDYPTAPLAAGPYAAGPAGTKVPNDGSVVFEGYGGPNAAQRKYPTIANRFGPVVAPGVTIQPAPARTRNRTRFERFAALNNDPVAMRRALRNE